MAIYRAYHLPGSQTLPRDIHGGESAYRPYLEFVIDFRQPYPGYFYTGDGAARDEHGYIWIKGRVDGEQPHVSQSYQYFDHRIG